MTDATPDYLTVAEIAEDLRVAPMTVYRWIHQGRIPALRLGRRTYRIPASNYLEYKRTLHADAASRAGHTTEPIPGQTEIPA